MSPPPPPVFARPTRLKKRRRAAQGFAEHAFLHERAAADIVDRLESILRRFERAFFHGPGAALLREALTARADVGTATTGDELPGPGVDLTAAPDALPREDASVDLFCSVMMLHAVDDVPGALSEAARILKPDGLFVGVFPGERTLFELRDVLQTAEATVTGRVAPRVHPFIAVRDGGALLQHAGFALPVADVASVTINYADPGRLLADLRGAGETSALAQGPRGALRRDVLAEALALYQERYPSPDGRGVRATADLVALTGWKPHPSQPKPLAPGSGKVSLKEAVRQTDS